MSETTLPFRWGRVYGEFFIVGPDGFQMNMAYSSAAEVSAKLDELKAAYDAGGMEAARRVKEPEVIHG